MDTVCSYIRGLIGARTLFLILVTGYLALIWKDMLSLRPDGLYAGHPYVWADWSMHLGLAAAIAFKPINLWFSSFPVFAGEPLTYPFLANLISGVLMRLGLSIPSAFILPSFVLSLLSCIALVAYYTKLLTTQRSAVLASLLFFCSGGLGAFLLARDVGWSRVIMDASLVTTQIDAYGIQTNNIFSSMMIPQRAFLLGLPIGLWIFSTLMDIRNDRRHGGSRTYRRTLLCAGIAAGVLPIAHTHTFLVVVGFSVWFFVFTYRKIRLWLWYGIPALLTTTLTYGVFLYGKVAPENFFSLHPGWLSPPGLVGWIQFWWYNWGVFFILACVGTYQLWRQQKHPLFQSTLFFWVTFLGANILSFQPQLWDNTKLFAWSYIGLAPAAVTALRRLWCTQMRGMRWMVAVLVFLSTFSGGIDLMHNLAESKTFRMLSYEQIEFAHWVRTHTPAEAVFLTSEQVTNPVSMLGGRSTLVGYSGWLYSYGLDYTQRLRDVQALYQDSDSKASLLSRYNVTHMVYSVDEARVFPTDPFAGDYQKVFSNTYGSIYEHRFRHDQ